MRPAHRLRPLALLALRAHRLDLADDRRARGQQRGRVRHPGRARERRGRSASIRACFNSGREDAAPRSPRGCWRRSPCSCSRLASRSPRGGGGGDDGGGRRRARTGPEAGEDQAQGQGPQGRQGEGRRPGRGGRHRDARSSATRRSRSGSATAATRCSSANPYVRQVKGKNFGRFKLRIEAAARAGPLPRPGAQEGDRPAGRRAGEVEEVRAQVHRPRPGRPRPGGRAVQRPAARAGLLQHRQAPATARTPSAR